MSKVTMRMIAPAAKVSPTTVSHVLNDTEGTFIAPATRKNVLATAKKMGYQKSVLSRSIKKSLHHLGIATAISDVKTLDPTTVIFDAFRQRALTNNFLTVDLPISAGLGVWTPKSTVKKMKELHQTKLIDGYLIDKQYFTNDAIKSIRRANIPAVLVNGEPYETQSQNVLLPSVIIDNYQAAHKAVEHLSNLGHKNIAMITRPYDRLEKQFHPYQVSRLRKGFYGAMQAADLPCKKADAIDGDPQDRAFTLKALTKIMGRKVKPTAIIVGDDTMAIMILQQLKAMKLSVPNDISVLSCGGWESVTRLWPVPITITQACLSKNGHQAADMLIGFIKGKPAKQDVITLPAELIIGQTTGPVTE